MTDEQILTKAIEKAVGNGWNRLRGGMYPNISIENLAADISSHGWQYRKLVFDHDFAKAFWGEDPDPSSMVCGECSNYLSGGWEHHLQQMVLEEEPLQYLARFL